MQPNHVAGQSSILLLLLRFPPAVGQPPMAADVSSRNGAVLAMTAADEGWGEVWAVGTFYDPLYTDNGTALLLAGGNGGASSTLTFLLRLVHARFPLVNVLLYSSRFAVS